MQADPRPAAAILRYVYPGVTPKNGRVVVVEGAGGCVEMRGGEIVERLAGDGVDAARWDVRYYNCLLYTSPSPRDGLLSRMPSSA